MPQTPVLAVPANKSPHTRYQLSTGNTDMNESVTRLLHEIYTVRPAWFPIDPTVANTATLAHVDVVEPLTRASTLAECSIPSKPSLSDQIRQHAPGSPKIEDTMAHFLSSGPLAFPLKSQRSGPLHPPRAMDACQRVLARPSWPLRTVR